MREIKFRAWNKIVKRYSQCLTLEQLHKEDIRFDLLVWEQFTGLKDKNGVEIYEGDIITTENYTMYGGIYKVFFDQQLLAFCFDKRLVSTTLLARAIGIEVIGNIYQNPELLK